ncbi:MAG: glycosyltransferase family 4 protein [Clostridia bacterium]|nr:glycosyltransferase family 4 protein [Clostridia bacterium]
MSRIKIVHVITDTNIGGAGKVLENYLSCFDREKFDICVVLPRKSTLAGILKKTQATVVAFDGLKGKSIDIFSIVPMIRLFKKLKPDIVHTHASFTSRIAARLYGKCRIVYTRHCVYPPSGLMKSLPGKIAGRMVSALFSDAVIAISPAAAQNLRDTGISKRRIHVMMNGTAPLKQLTPDEKENIREKYKIAKEDRVAGTVSRLEPDKGLQYFIEAARICLNENKCIKFIISGSGSMEKELKDMSADMEGSMIFTGFLDDVSETVNIIDVFVNASYGTEASSISILEAMSLGKPVVATNYGGNPYQVADGETGLIVPVKDSGAIAKAILKLLSDRNAYDRLSENAAREYNMKYTADAMSRNIEKIYIELAGTRRKRRAL